jgi:hypothetical protein
MFCLPLRCFRTPPVVRIPQVEDYCTRVHGVIIPKITALVFSIVSMCKLTL